MIYDISMLIEPSMQTYKHNQESKPKFKTKASHETSSVHGTEVTLDLHTGTHIDFPLHMIKDGATSDSENLEPLIGQAKVLDFTHVEGCITVSDLKQKEIEKNDFLLFKTKSSFSNTFLDDFVYLEEQASLYLVEQQIRGVGTDALGIEDKQPNHPTHKNLLSNNIVILEGLRLKEVPEGMYDFIFLPLKIKGVEASLGRAVLLDRK